jgi:hypothetical protein
VGEEELNLSKGVLSRISNLKREALIRVHHLTLKGTCNGVAVGVDFLGYPPALLPLSTLKRQLMISVSNYGNTYFRTTLFKNRYISANLRECSSLPLDRASMLFSRAASFQRLILR